MTDKKMVVLDCTLRDGGYYNDWDFDPDMARDTIAALVAAGVDVIELGYKSRETKGFFGLFRFCDEEALAPLLPADRGQTRFAFMVDAKEFLVDAHTPDDAAVRSVIRPAAQSHFSVARVATHPQTIRGAGGLVAALKGLGYEVALNIMGISTLGERDLAATLAALDGVPVDVLYLADSYGSLSPTEAVQKVLGLRAGFSGALGVHMHENQGLALANTLAALEAGATWIDSTLSGMGRGAGNARTEQLLLSLYFRHGRQDLRPSAVLPVLQRHFAPMQREYGWGWDFTYMLSGLVEIHPTYCQELRTGARYNVEDVAAILEEIPVSMRARYSEEALLAAEERNARQKKAARGEAEVTIEHVVAQAEEILVVASGPSTRRHGAALRALAARRGARVLECNDSGVLDGMDRTTVVLNPLRVAELAQRLPADDRRTLVVGMSHVPGVLAGPRTHRVDFELRAGRFDPMEGPTLPGFVVGMLAVALALRARPKRLLLAGFDGFPEPERRAEQSEMEAFWALVRSAATDVELMAVTPTSYKLPSTSVYALLQDMGARS